MGDSTLIASTEKLTRQQLALVATPAATATHRPIPHQMQRNFDGMTKQVEAWRQSQISDVAAKLVIYRAFIESDLEVPKHLARPVHDQYFNPQHEEFQPRTLWSLSNAFTSAFKELDPIPQYKATAKLGGFLAGQ